MEHIHRKIALGFTNQEFDPGFHICQIFNDDEERLDALLKYILSGLQTGEKTACFSEKLSKNELDLFLEKSGISFEKKYNTGAIDLTKTEDVYFPNNSFDPDKMISLLAKFYEDSVKQGFTAARVIGEMSPKVQKINGGSRLLEYESKVSLLLKKISCNSSMPVRCQRV